MQIESYLESIGFEKRLPWQFHNDSYYISVLEKDSFGFSRISITNKRYDEQVFRGRILSEEGFQSILRAVKEDYDLTNDDIRNLI